MPTTMANTRTRKESFCPGCRHCIPDASNRNSCFDYSSRRSISGSGGGAGGSSRRSSPDKSSLGGGGDAGADTVFSLVAIASPKNAMVRLKPAAM